MIESVEQILLQNLPYEWLSQSVLGLFGITILALLGFIIHAITHYTLLKLAIKIVQKTSLQWDDLLVKNKIFQRCLYLLTVSLLQSFNKTFFLGHEGILNLNANALNVLFILVILSILDGLINLTYDLWHRIPNSERLPAKSLIQAVKLVLYSIGFIFILAAILDKSPAVFLSGLGALTAVLLLVFKEPILGLVAGVQLSTNDLVKVGDWIEMPSHSTDGTVVDISLTTLKVENWNQTISSIPMQSLITNSFKNWRHMSTSGGRRIKRSIIIDTNSLKFLDSVLIEKLKTIPLIKGYLDETLEEIDRYNKEVSDQTKIPRQLTNIGVFRKYCLEYLKKNPQINSEMTLIVRQLAPTGQGIPLEIWTYSNTTNWVHYESIQSDLFDHLFTALSNFDLRAYQRPNGKDLHYYQDGSAKIDL